MDMLQKVLELDFAYLATFTERIDTEWGCLFLNEQQPDRYDANHAHVSCALRNPKAVIAEVIAFYQARNITPRFYIYDLPNQSELLSELRAAGFGTELFESAVQLWDNQLPPAVSDHRIQIETVTEGNFHEALEIECSIKEFGGREVREKAFTEEFRHQEYTYYLLRYDGKACSTACLFEHGKQARMESVATLAEFRGKGLIGHLIRHIQAEARDKGIEHLWVFPISDRVESVYARYDFSTIETLQTAHAFLGGKSITEIREA